VVGSEGQNVDAPIEIHRRVHVDLQLHYWLAADLGGLQGLVSAWRLQVSTRCPCGAWVHYTSREASPELTEMKK